MTNERTVAGHRVLRMLARGDRSEVWLAADDIVLKVLDSPVPVDAPGHEVEALHRARGDHVIELLDVSLGEDGAVLVFPRLPRGSLSELLSRRQVLDVGEAVTIVAPIATCLARMHAAGVAHGALSPASVLFRGDGAPMLTGFGRAEPFDPGLPEVALERIAGVAADRGALVGIADAVLARTTGARAKPAARLREELRAMDPAELVEQVPAALFDLAAARPVRFDAAIGESGDGAGRVVAVSEPVIEADRPSTGWSTRLLESGPGAVVVPAMRKRWSEWSVRRRRAVLAAGAAGLAVVVAFAVVPGPAAPSTAVGSETVPAPTTEPVGAGPDGDDPLDALRELASRRDTCFRDLSVLCLDGVDEAGSSAWEVDRAALRAVVEGADSPPRLTLTAASLVERLGDSALVDLGPDSDPASVLLLKGEAGWRIRDYLAPVGGEVAEEG